MKALLSLFLLVFLFAGCGPGRSDYELDEASFRLKTLH